jgi:hypothetical protein
MLCEYCKEAEVIEGILEGVSFVPSSEQKKWLASGVYGIKAMVCPSCGRLYNFNVDIKSLKKIVKE